MFNTIFTAGSVRLRFPLVVMTDGRQKNFEEWELSKERSRASNTLDFQMIYPI